MGDDRLDQLDYYTLLGVTDDADTPAIKRAFRKFARRYHPDRFAESPERVARANAIYRRGSEAYQVLIEPASRKAYDALLASGQVRMSAEARDRAIIEAREAHEPKEKSKPEDSIGSPQARAFHDKAVASARAGDWRGAWQHLRKALEHEPGNVVLKKKLRKCEARLRSGL